MSKTLFQLREERREAEEHAEAMRREQLALDLAEAAEAEVAGGPGGEGGGGVVDNPNPMDALDMDVDRDDPLLGGDEGEVDLDDEIPDADEGGFGFDGASDDEDEDEDEEDEEEDEGADSDADRHGGSPEHGRQQRQAQQQEVANMRATEDRMREMMTRNQGSGRGMSMARRMILRGKTRPRC